MQTETVDVDELMSPVMAENGKGHVKSCSIYQTFPLFSPEEGSVTQSTTCIKVDSHWHSFLKMREEVLGCLKRNDRLKALASFWRYVFENFPGIKQHNYYDALTDKFRDMIIMIRREIESDIEKFLSWRARDIYGSEGRVRLINDPLKLLEISAIEPVTELDKMRKFRARIDLLLGIMAMQCDSFVSQYHFEHVAEYLEEFFFKQQDCLKRLFLRTHVINPKPLVLRVGEIIHLERDVDLSSLKPTMVDEILTVRECQNNFLIGVQWDEKSILRGIYKILRKKLVDNFLRPDPSQVTDWYRMSFIVKGKGEVERLKNFFPRLIPSMALVMSENPDSNAQWVSCKFLGTINNTPCELQIIDFDQYVNAKHKETANSHYRYKQRQFPNFVDIYSNSQIYNRSFYSTLRRQENSVA